MESDPHRECVLLIGPEEGLTESLNTAGFTVVAIESDADIYEAVERLEPAAILVSADSPSRDTLEHLAGINRKYPQPTLLLHGSKNPDVGQRALERGISAYVTEGLTPAAMRSLIEVSVAHAKQLQSLRQELARKQKTLTERKYVDSAKRVLWNEHGMNEETAYKVLKNHAMNSRCSIAEAAKRLLESKKSSDADPSSGEISE